MHSKFRIAGWLAVSSLLAAALLAPAAVSANGTHSHHHGPKPTESAPAATESAPAETESAPTETKSAPTETRSAPVETESAPVETESAPVETESVEVNPNCPDCAPEGSVDAATGTPKEGITPPATDTITPESNPSNSGWQLIVLALAGLLATALILTPAKRRTRR